MEEPRRPMSAFLLWLKVERNNIKAEHPNLKVTEIAKLAGEKWRSLDKSPWKDKAAIAWEEYKCQMKEYNANNKSTSKQYEFSDTSSDEEIMENIPKEKPIRPMSSYMMWLNAERNNIRAQHPSLRITQISKLAGQQWQSMDKTLWAQKAATALRKYNKKMKAYKFNNNTKIRTRQRQALQLTLNDLIKPL